MNLGRLQFSMPTDEWLSKATAPPLVQMCRLDAEVAGEVANLPDTFHRDPADRIIVATARLREATLVTADLKIIESNIVRTL